MRRLFTTVTVFRSYPATLMDLMYNYYSMYCFHDKVIISIGIVISYTGVYKVYV